MDTVRIPFEELPPIIRDEIAALEMDFAHLPEERRWQAIKDNLSDESWRYIDELVALRLATLVSDVPKHVEE